MAVVSDCPGHIGELLTAYLDGELRSGELDQVAAHLTDCSECIVEFHALKETRAALRSLPMLWVPESLIPNGHYTVQLSSYLDGELPTAEYQLMFTHLQECVDCRANLHELDVARTAVRSLPGLEPPEFLMLGGERIRTKRIFRSGRIAAGIGTIAAAVLVVLGVSSISDTPPTAVDLDSFADRHVARASVEPGFQVIPAVSSGGSNP